MRNWHAIKAQEKAAKPAHPADEVPRSLPALMRAFELGRKCDWPQVSARDVTTLAEDISAETAHAQIGQLLLAVTDYARTLGVNPDTALRDATEARLTEGLAREDTS